MKIALLGDIAPFGSFDVTKWSEEQWSRISRISDYLRQCDYVICNLECPFSIKKKTAGAKSAYLCCNPENISLLKFLHITHANIANNHIFDYGKEGYELTKQILESNDIEWFGGEGKSIRICNKKNSIALEGFCCYSTNPRRNVHYGKYGINEFDVDVVADKLQKYNEDHILPILSIHAGIEHVNFPDIMNIEVARYFAEKTSYIYYGHHPHVVQGLEFYQNSLIAHSLGNFIFDDIYDKSGRCQLELTTNNRTSCILEIVIEDNVIVAYKEIPVIIGKGSLDFQPKSIIPPVMFSYEDAIAESIVDYQANRREIIRRRINQRKAMRNVKWYIDHLRWRYIQLQVTNLINRHRYKIHFTNKVKRIHLY